MTQSIVFGTSRAKIASVETTTVGSEQHSHRPTLRHEDPGALVRVVGYVVGFVVLERLLSAAAELDLDDGDASVLAIAAITGNWVATLLIAVVVGVAVVRGRTGTAAGWSSMDHGPVWRALSIPWIVAVAWFASAYPFNFMVGQWHTADRIVVVVLAIAAIAHPLFLVPFVFQARTVAAQFTLPFGATTLAGADRLVIVALVVVATTFLVVAITGDSDTSAGLLLLSMAVAAHFFVPGRAKIGLDWLTTTDLHNFAYSSYTTGWRGAGDGTWSRVLASTMQTLRWPIVIGTAIVEVGAAIAVFHRRLMRWWLVGFVALHIAILLASGFWLFGWMIVELGLLIVLCRRDLVDWVSRNDTLGRGAIAVVIVGAFGSAVFDPPRLAWLDAPVSYGYEVDAVGESGTSYHVPLDGFGGSQQDLVFLFAEFGRHETVVAGYGASAGVEFYAMLGAITTFDELRALETEFPLVDEATRAMSEQTVVRWLDHVNSSRGDPWFMVAPPSRFWVDRPDPTYDHSEPLRSLTVVLVRSIHDDGGQRFDRETVLRVDVGESGRAAVTERVQADDNGG